MLLAPAPDHVVWLDDAFVRWRDATMHVTSHHYGVGVFEGVRAYPTAGAVAIFRLADHTDRLFRSAHILNLRIPYSREHLNRVQCEVVRRNRLESAYLRPLVFHDGIAGLGLHTQGLTVHVLVAAVGWQDGAYPQAAHGGPLRGLRVRTSSLIRHHPNAVFTKAKANGNYMNSILALQEARACGADDALLLDAQGFVAEGSGANVFVVRRGVVYTPPTTSALEGITRETIWSLAEGEGIPVREKQITRDEVYIADEVFFTGTAVEVLPVVELDGRAIGAGATGPGPITTRLATLYHEHVRGMREDRHGWLAVVPP